MGSEPRIYLDHAATTPVREEAIQAWVDAVQAGGNPSSVHRSGRGARRILEEAREQVAELIGAEPTEVIFTSGGTESDNLAVKGMYWHHNKSAVKPRVLVSAIEHSAVLESAQWLAHYQGAELEFLPVSSEGRVDPESVETAIDRNPHDVALISVMWANNEVGTVQNIAQIASIAERHGVSMHTDAVQAIGHLPVSFRDSGVQALSLTGHKCGAPIGTGALVVQRGLDLVSLTHGGGQDRAIRSGTLDAPGAAALAAGLAVAEAEREAETARIIQLRDRLLAGVLAAVPDAVVRGPAIEASALTTQPCRLPGNLHLTIPGCAGDLLLLALDTLGISASVGSACHAGVARPSHVLQAMGVTAPEAAGALRLTLGWTTTEPDVNAAVAAIGTAVTQVRQARG